VLIPATVTFTLQIYVLDNTLRVHCALLVKGKIQNKFFI